jgi:hypothetical protein
VTKFLWLLCLLPLTGVSQNLETIGKENPLSVSGSISLNQIFYGVHGIESRRDPYSYYASGNINFSLYGWSVPLSFSVSNQNVSYQQPFNQYGLHPTYKWVTAHVGYNAMTFSPYTLSGHLFNGVGIDLAPGEKFKFSAMYGRLLKAVEPDSLNENASIPSFKRMGYGFKAHYGDSKYFGEVSLFRAKDDSTSIAYIPEDEGILPQENLVLSFSGGVTLFQKLLLKAGFANSAITRDIRAEEGDGPGIFGNAGFLFTSRISTSYYKAIKGSLSYAGNGYNLGFGYERIDPEYKTLGAYYFNSDLENITVNGATALVGGKVNLAANVGVQHDNLDGSKISTMRRWVSALNVGFAPSDKFNLSAGYSSFQTYTNIRSQFVDINQLTQYDNLDTLNFTQITQNLNLNANYVLPGSEKRRQNLSANASIMKAADEQGGVEQNTGSIFYNVNAAYSLNMVPKNLTLSASINLSQNKALSARSSTLGPTFSISKSLLDKKLRMTGSYSLNNTYTQGSMANRVNSLRANASYTLKKKHNFNLSMVGLNRATKLETGVSDFTEFTGTLGYSYSF